ncbi:MAG TPA: hypothetical protein VEP90_16740 [Methylomirabilota bacterium]|nr:hypothetical protein [Methylomirabilota bacterium]
MKSEKLPGIEGRTLLAKLDFFIRYPMYLKMAAQILDVNISDEGLGLETVDEMHSVESRMVRYLYGPWDDAYYLALGYLVGKELIEVEKNGRHGTEIFRLTWKGQEVLAMILKSPSYTDLAARADTVYCPHQVGHKFGDC